jgi:hypothetical protein
MVGCEGELKDDPKGKSGEKAMGQEIIVVSGLPRSGTSMMMRMLEAGGIELLTDRIRAADEDNPQGYYEFEKVKQLEHDSSWMHQAKGKAVKIVLALLKFLPAEHLYKVIFMRRQLDEVLASQKQMLIRRGEPAGAVTDERMADLFQRHVKRLETWLGQQPNIEVLDVSYNEVIKNPIEPAHRINQFLGGGLDVRKMTEVVDTTLYRQRR